MRWMIEVSSVGKPDRQSYCVESESWQRALQAARGIRDDHGPMTGFSIELLDDGFSAIDPMTRLRYRVTRAPDDAPLTPTSPSASKRGSMAPPRSVPPSASSSPPPSKRGSVAPPPGSAPASASTQPVSAPLSGGRAKTFLFGSTGAAMVAEASGQGEPQASAKAVAPRPDRPAPLADAPALLSPPVAPSVEVLFRREQDPDSQSPLTYREYVYFSPAASDESMARAMLLAEFELVRSAIQSARPGKLVNLAMFDVSFQGRAPVPPIVTLTWKDWKGEPTLEFPRRPAAAASVPPSAAAQPETSSSRGFPPARTVAPSENDVAGARSAEGLSPRETADPFPLTTPAKSSVPAPAPGPSAPSSVRRSSKPTIRLRGDELIADLFEAMHDLHFLRDSLEGADFCLTLALEKIPSRVGVVHAYDIDRREFIVTSARGPNHEAVLSRRYPEKDPILAKAMRRRRAVVWSDAGEASGLDRYRELGGVSSLVVAPVMLAGRFLGAIELLDPVDGSPFREDEGHALSYIAEQFAEFLATRGVTLDPERIARSARG